MTFLLFDKLTDITIEPSTLLVEFTDWLSALQPCTSSVSRIGTISQTLSGCAPSIFSCSFSHRQPSLFLLHRSPLWAPHDQSPFARIWARDQHHVFSEYLPGCHSQNPPRSSKSWFPFAQGVWYQVHRLPNGVHLVMFFRLFTKYHQNHFHRLQNCDVPPRWRAYQDSSDFSPKLPVHILQGSSPSE